MKLRRIVTSTAAASLLALPLAAVASSPSLAAPSTAQMAERKVQRIVLDQGVPGLKVVESADGASNIVLFVADLTTNSGTSAGKLTGSITTIAGSGNGVAGSARQRELVFDLPKGQLVAIGNSLYPEGATEMDQNKPVTIAIVGGTGRYMGARGEVRTNRNADGTYRHVLTLLR